MDLDDARPRRRILQAAAVTMAGSTAAIAGCTDQEDDEEETEAEEGTGNGQEQDGEEPDEAEDDEDDDDVAHDDDGDLGEDEADEEDEDDEPDEDVEQILLATDEDEVWIGQEPSEIEGEENPTLELVAGWEYEIGYVNRDGDSHNLALWADDEERDATDVNEEEDEEQWLTVEASDDLTSYRCEVHPDSMVGDIEVDE